MAQQQQAIHKFVLGNKELDGKAAEFQYDRGWYSITEILGEERNVIYKSRNAQEAYMRWNVYIGRKKERPVSEERRKIVQGDGEERQGRSERGARERDRDRNKDRSKDRGRDRSNREENAWREERNNRGNRDHRRSRSDRNRRYRESAEQQE